MIFSFKQFDAEKEYLKFTRMRMVLYNAIGVDYYSEEARQSYKQIITTVNFKMQTCLRYSAVLGMLNDFGHFSLDGFTIKKTLTKNNKLFNRNCGFTRIQNF